MRKINIQWAIIYRITRKFDEEKFDKLIADHIGKELTGKGSKGKL